MFDKKMTEHLAKLSMIAFTDDELDIMTEQMRSITALMDKIRDIDGLGEEYTLDPLGYSDLREDAECASLDTGELLKNAKVTKNDSFTVPKIIDFLGN